MEKQCTKIKFETEDKAKVALYNIRKENNKKKLPKRVYFCYCGSWHLTSRLDIKEIEKENSNLKMQIENLKIWIEKLKLDKRYLRNKIAHLQKIFKK